MPTTKSPSLSDLQTWMRWVLTHPHGVGCALKNHTHPLQRCVNVIGETPQVDRETRLSIYGNGYFGRIIEVLEANFSSVKNVVGTDAFQELARNYLVKYPSTFRSIDDVGHRMSEFIKTHSLQKKFPFLSDLAAIEWGAHQSFFADDWPLLDPLHFRRLPESAWKKAIFTLDPSVKLFHTRWPVDEIWRMDGKLKKSRAHKIKKENFHILIYRRPNKMVRVPRVTALQFDLLTQLNLKKPLGEALLYLVKNRTFNDEVLPVQDWFQEWMSSGVIRKINFNSTWLRK